MRTVICLELWGRSVCWATAAVSAAELHAKLDARGVTPARATPAAAAAAAFAVVAAVAAAALPSNGTT